MRKMLANAKNIIWVKVSSLIVPVDLIIKTSKLSRVGLFLFYCPFNGGYFSAVDLEMGVRILLREVSVKGGKNVEF